MIGGGYLDGMFSMRNIKTGSCLSALMVMMGAFTAWNVHGVLLWVLTWAAVLGDLLIVVAPATAFQPEGWVHPVGLCVWATMAARHACLGMGRSMGEGLAQTRILGRGVMPTVRFAAGSIVGALSSQVHGRALLPGWLVLLLATCHALVVTHATTTPGTYWDWERLFAAVLSLVFIPWLIQVHMSKKRALAAKESAVAVASADGLGTSSQAALANAGGTPAMQHSKPAVLHTPAQRHALGMLFRLRRTKHGNDTAEHGALYQQAYKRMKVVAKVHTNAGLEALPAEWPHMMQAASYASGRELQLLTCAARHGCILLSIDVAPQPLQEVDAVHEHNISGDVQPANTATSSSRNEPQHGVADSVLLSLQPILSQLESSSVGANGGLLTRPLLPHGLRVTVQVNQQMYEALWDSALGCWGVRAGANVQPPPPKASLGLVRMTACMAPSTSAAALVHYTAVRSNSNSSSSSSITTTSSSSNAGSSSSSSSSSSVLSCRLQVQVWDWPGHASDAQGWSPKVHAVPEQESAGLEQQGISILAHTSGHYLTTCVRAVTHEEFQSSMLPARALLLNVDVALPANLLICHHQPDGAPTGLQPMTLELWTGQHVLHSTQVLLRLPQQVLQQAGSTHPSALLPFNMGSCKPGVWWWGAKPKAVQAAVHELDLAAQKLWMLGAAVRLTEVQAHQAWQADVVTWLQAAQQGARKCKRCLVAQGSAVGGGLSTGGAIVPQLPAALAQHTGQCLLQHAANHQLHAIHAMLTQQMRLVVQPLTCTSTYSMESTSKARSVQIAAAALRHIGATMWGFSCQQCEAAFKAQLSKQVAGLQLCGAGLQTVTCGLAAYQQQMQLHTGAVVPFAICAALGVVSILQLLRAPGQCCGLSVWSWLLRLSFMWYFAKQHMAGCVSGRLSRFLAMHAVSRIRDQLPASVFLPAPVVTGLSMLDFMAWSRVLCQHPNATFTNWLLLLGSTVVLWLLQLQLRIVLKPVGHPKEAGANQCQSRRLLWRNAANRMKQA